MNTYLKRLLILALIMGFWQIVAAETLKNSIYTSQSFIVLPRENIFNYEYELGADMKGYGEMWVMIEREWNIDYSGYYLETEKTKIRFPKYDILKLLTGISGKIHIDTSKSISEQWLFKDMYNLDLYILGKYSIRMSNRWQEWQYRGVLVGIEWRSGMVKISYDTNFHDSRILEIKISTRFIKGEKGQYFSEPMFVMVKSEDTEFYQLKHTFGILF